MATHTTQKEFTGVKLYVDWTMASERANILTGAKTDDVHGEALATSMGKIAKWYTDFTPLVFSKKKVDGVTFDQDIIHYATCSTAAATVSKTVDCTGFNLVTGAWIAVRFTVTNTGAVANLTLNVNNTGAKSIKYRNANLSSAGVLAANRTYLFVYDGTYYQIIGDLDTNGNNYDRIQLQERLYAGGVGVFQYCLCAMNNNQRIEAFTTTGGTGTSKVWNTSAKFLYPPNILYHSANSTIANGSVIANAALYESIPNANLQYSSNLTTSNNGFSQYKAIYLEISFDSDGLWSPTTTGITQTLTSGKYYIFLGGPYNTSIYQLCLNTNNPVYYYDGTNLIDANLIRGVKSVTVSGTGNAVTTASLSNGTLTLEKGTTFLHAGNTSYTPSITSGTKLGTITIDGTSTDIYSTGKLDSPVNIELGTGVASTATAFDGSENITIPVTAIREAYLAWGGKNFSGKFGPLDAALNPCLGANRMEMTKAAGITIERSTDSGSTWTTVNVSDINKQTFMSSIGYTIPISGTSTANLGTDAAKNIMRVTIDTSAGSIYTYLNKFIIYLSTNGCTDCYVKIRIRTQADFSAGNDTWKTWDRVNKSWSSSVTESNSRCPVSGWSGFNVINLTEFPTYGNLSWHYRNIQFIFGCETNTSTYAGMAINSIQGYGGVGWTTPSTMARTGHLYSYNGMGAATFPSTISASGGTLTGSLVIKGTAASKPLITRGIYGSDGNGNTGDLYVQYIESGSIGKTYFGGSTYYISENGSTYNGSAAKVNGHTVEKDVPSDAVFTDTKVTATTLPATTADATYRLTFVSAAGTSGVNIMDSVKVLHTKGTTSVTGNSRILLGNNTVTGTASNEEGLIRLYTPGSGHITLKGAQSNSNTEHTFPATSGIVLNTGTTSFTQTLTSGTKIGSIKINGTSTDIYCQTNTNTTYTLSGAYGSNNNTWVTTLTPSSGTATTSTVPTATIGAYGITKLSSATDSNSVDLAATPYAVKAAYDLASSKSVVSFSPNISSNATNAYKIGTITINGTATDIYGEHYISGYNWDGDGNVITNVILANGEWTFYKNLYCLKAEDVIQGTGISITTTGESSDEPQTVTINHSNSVTAVTTASMLKVKYDAQGHITGSSAFAAADVSSLINLLTVGTVTPSDNDYYVSQYAGGGTSTTSYHRRPVSALWTYIKGKADSVYSPISHTHSNYLGAIYANSYWGMAKPDGTTTDWIRTTSSGIIPYESGSLGSGHQKLGTSTWYFSESYIDTMYSGFVNIAGTLPQLKFRQTTSGSEYNSNNAGIKCYPANTDSMTMTIQSGGNMIIGSGEFPTNFYNATKTVAENWTDSSEKTCIGSDAAVLIITNGNTIADRKVFTFGSDFNLAIGGNVVFRYGTYNSYTSNILTSAATTTKRTWTLPNKTGTIALTSDLVDTKVTQSAATGNNYRPLIMGSKHSTTAGDSALQDTITDQVYANSSIYANPNTGTIYANRFKGESDYVRHCYAKNDTALTGKWVKIATCTSTLTNDDKLLVLLVSNGYSSAYQGHGILRCRFRTGSTKGTLHTASLSWDYITNGLQTPVGTSAPDKAWTTTHDIDPSNFVATYTATSGTSLVYDLWVKVAANYQSWTFTALNDVSRTGNVWGPFWTLSDYASTGGQDALPSSTGQVVSKVATLYGINDNPEWVTLTNGSGLNSVSVLKCKKQGNIVYIKGMFGVSSTTGTITPMAVLPDGYYATDELRHISYSPLIIGGSPAAGTGDLQINTTGTINLYTNSSSTFTGSTNSAVYIMDVSFMI